MAPLDPTDAVTTALFADPRVRSVELVGSRAEGTETRLSDWDYRIGSPDPEAVAQCLPDLVLPLWPLSHFWDPLAHHPVYMLILRDAACPGVVKVDLLLDLPLRTPSPDPPALTAATLPGIDAHFWDWNLWLGSKRLRGDDKLVQIELARMWKYLLEPLGSTTAPHTQEDAIADYQRLRHIQEQRHGVGISPDLGNAVRATLKTAELLQSHSEHDRC